MSWVTIADQNLAIFKVEKNISFLGLGFCLLFRFQILFFLNLLIEIHIVFFFNTIYSWCGVKTDSLEHHKENVSGIFALLGLRGARLSKSVNAGRLQLKELLQLQQKY